MVAEPTNTSVPPTPVVVTETPHRPPLLPTAVATHPRSTHAGATHPGTPATGHPHPICSRRHLGSDRW